MRFHRLRRLIVVLLDALIIGAPWPSLAQQPIRIGATMSLTGKQYSLQGGYGREGYLLCEKHVNAQGGVLGRPIQFVIRQLKNSRPRAGGPLEQGGMSARAEIRHHSSSNQKPRPVFEEEPR